MLEAVEKKHDPERCQDVLICRDVGSWGRPELALEVLELCPKPAAVREQGKEEDSSLCRKQRCPIIKEQGVFGFFVGAGRDMGQSEQRLGVGCMSFLCRSSFCPAMSKSDWGWRRTSPSMEMSFPIQATSSKASKLETNGTFLPKLSTLF